MVRWVEETFHPHWRVGMKADRVLHEVKTEHQHLVIFENATWGTVLMLDGVCQLTTSDEFVYHEMMAHVPLMQLEKPRRVLVVGGGDGGVLREVLKHPSVETATLVEIDRTVVDTALAHYPSIPGSAFDDPRADVVIADGLVVNGALANLDDQQKTAIVDRVLKHRKGKATLWVLTKDDLASRFDRVLQFEHGRLTADKQQQALSEAAQ